MGTPIAGGGTPIIGTPAAGGGGTPSGPAGGDLAGTYPNPTVAGIAGATAPIKSSAAGGLSTGTGPVMTLTGALATGGTGTTTVPFIFINQAVTQPTNWNTSGTILGFNAPSGFTAGAFIDCRVNGQASSFFSVNAQGTISGTGSITMVGTGAYSFTTSTVATTCLTVKNSAASPTGLLQIWVSTSTNVATLDPKGTFAIRQIIGLSGAPAIAGGTGAGTTPTVGVTGNNTAGQITVTPGTSPTASAAVVTVTFANAFAYTSAPFPTLT